MTIWTRTIITKYIRLAIPVVVMLAILPFPAHAYLDPGTGSMIVQLVVGAIAVAGMTLKMYWRKILGLFNHRPNEKKDAED
jgi:hypothetical protein